MTFITETFQNRWWKAVQSFICYSWIFNVQLHVHVQNLTVKFKLLYLLNYISRFSKICKIRCVNVRIQIPKVSLKSMLFCWHTELFLGQCFFLLAHRVPISSLPVSSYPFHEKIGVGNGMLQVFQHKVMLMCSSFLVYLACGSCKHNSSLRLRFTDVFHVNLGVINLCCIAW